MITMRFLRHFAIFLLLLSPCAAEAKEKWTVDSLKVMSDGNDPEAQFELGKLYMSGKGVDKDINEGLNLFMKSASAGYSKSQHVIGKLYRDGLYLKQSETNAREWFEKAAKQGYWVAQYDLAALYARYRSNKEAMILAYAWFDVLDKRGHPKAHKGRDEIKKELEKPDLVKAKRNAETFYERYVVPFEKKPKKADDEKPSEDSSADTTKENE
ncbi:MAG: tetratricopeptide repeat protein [Alcanivorax sp.]